MEMIQILLYLAVLATAFPVGYFLAWLCKEELVDGKKWFKLLVYFFALILIIAFLVTKDIPVSLGLIYIIILSAVSVYKEKDRKFLKS